MSTSPDDVAPVTEARTETHWWIQGMKDARDFYEAQGGESL
jgi:hypothetical protein